VEKPVRHYHKVRSSEQEAGRGRSSEQEQESFENYYLIFKI
jgi:hypothetical protein